jgi:hypothetical protein
MNAYPPVKRFIVSWPEPFRYNCDHGRKIDGSIAGQLTWARVQFDDAEGRAAMSPMPDNLPAAVNQMAPRYSKECKG